MKKSVFILFSVVFFTCGVFAQSNFGTQKAQNLSKSFAVGASIVDAQSIISDIPSLTIRYWFDKNVAAEALFSLSNGDKGGIIYGGGKLLAIIKNYGSANLYALASAGFGSSKDSGEENEKGILNLSAGLGIEWFIIDNLSISNEIVFSYFDRAGDANQFGISADWMPKAGIRVYL
ncbi:MAG: hypothetical protein LBV16_06135 [Elusimicrobiota bacterium]|jgi:hypothetical protein|nr:hypothetical protein [Elusimicrobiota bacterium]